MLINQRKVFVTKFNVLGSSVGDTQGNTNTVTYVMLCQCIF